MKSRISVLLIAIAAAGAAHAEDSNLARNLAATCANCHGTNGRSVGANESLAGEPKEKILSKLQAFRSGEKPSTIMQQIASGYTDVQLDMIASYFAAQQ